MSEKLQKVLAGSGVGSRREIEQWIQAGRVKVDNELAHLGQRVAGTEKIELDGQRVHLTVSQVPEILLVNKASGVVCSRQDDQGRKTIFDDLPRLRRGRWISVGRLDMQTTGLLLLTNDGALAHRMMHPSTGLDREYAVRVNGRLEETTLQQLIEGVEYEGERLAFSDIRYYNGSGHNHWYHVVLMEGKNREVRRLFEFVGLSVSRLKRVRYGPVVLPSSLKSRHWAYMLDEDVKALYKILGLRYAPPKGAKRVRRQHQMKVSCLLPYPKLAG